MVNGVLIQEVINNYETNLIDPINENRVLFANIKVSNYHQEKFMTILGDSTMNVVVDENVENWEYNGYELQLLCLC